MKKLFTFVITLFFAMSVFTGCTNEQDVNGDFCYECDGICQYANVEDFSKTTPFIDAYLNHISKNDWSDEQKLQALTDWLNAKPCIISAKIETENASYFSTSLKSMPIQPPKGKIAILLDVNGITQELFLYIGPRYPYDSDLWVATYYQYIKPREIIATIQPVSSVGMLFDMIDTVGFEVAGLTGLYFSSTEYSQEELFNYYGGKPYIIAIGTVPGSPDFSPTFINMDNKDYQDDWLKLMTDYQILLTKYPYSGSTIPVVTFLVPEGQEREWESKLLTDYEFITSTVVTWELESMRITYFDGP
ncbi:MAG: hypothetical protein LBE91_00620 [Tannerella sp.]|jgi:hypothetical protein|nr:hypothetical protein [Tannerella sp.]